MLVEEFIDQLQQFIGRKVFTARQVYDTRWEEHEPEAHVPIHLVLFDDALHIVGDWEKEGIQTLIKRQEEEKERQAKIQEQKDREERLEYERLKKKFEPE